MIPEYDLDQAVEVFLFPPAWAIPITLGAFVFIFWIALSSISDLLFFVISCFG